MNFRENSPRRAHHAHPTRSVDGRAKPPTPTAFWKRPPNRRPWTAMLHFALAAASLASGACGASDGSAPALTQPQTAGNQTASTNTTTAGTGASSTATAGTMVSTPGTTTADTTAAPAAGAAAEVSQTPVEAANSMDPAATAGSMTAATAPSAADPSTGNSIDAGVQMGTGTAEDSTEDTNDSTEDTDDSTEDTDDSTADAGEPAADAGEPIADAEAAEVDAQEPEEPLRPWAASLDLAITTENVGDAPYFNIWRPEDLDEAIETTGGKLPVAVWANGGCFRSDFTWEPLFKRWASAGFVVLALTAHPQQGPLSISTTDDHAALVAWAIEANDAQDGMFADKLDTSRIVATGNSCGGVSALEMTAKTPEVTSVFVLSGSSALGAVSTEIMSNVHVPVGYIVGAPGVDVAEANATGDYEALEDGLPGMVIRRFEGDHVLVSTDPTILELESRMALNWMDLTLYGTQEAYDELTSDTVCAGCDEGEWTLESKHLESLLEPPSPDDTP